MPLKILNPLIPQFSCNKKYFLALFFTDHSPNVRKVIKLRRVTWTKHVELMEKINTYRILVSKTEEKIVR
jgi:hypothetical protein